MIRAACLLALLLGLSVAPARAQAVDVRAAMLLDHRADFARETPPPIRPDTALADPWLGRDKVLHASASFLLTLSAQYVLTSKLDTDADTAVPIAAGAAFSLGLTKEFADSRRPVNPLFSTRDLVADAVGVALAVGLILL